MLASASIGITPVLAIMHGLAVPLVTIAFYAGVLRRARKRAGP